MDATMLKTFSACALLLAACGTTTPSTAPDAAPPDVEWRREAIVQIVPVAELPGHADQHCLASAGRPAQPGDEALLLYFKVGRGHYYQAFPSRPDDSWKVGDKVMFDSHTCQIKRAATTGN